MRLGSTGSLPGQWFHRDVFLLRPRTLTLTRACDIQDESERPLAYSARPAGQESTLGSTLLVIGGLFAGLLVAMMVSGTFWEKGGLSGTLGVAFGVLVGIAAGGAGVLLGLAVRPPCDVSVHEDESRKLLLVRVEQDRKFSPFSVSLSVRDGDGALIGTLRKSIRDSVFRRRWHGLDEGGGRFLAEEDGNPAVDSILALANHGIKRLSAYEFSAEIEGESVVVGRFVRRSGLFNVDLTSFEEHPDTLDMTGDPGFVMDRRLALAIALIVD